MELTCYDDFCEILLQSGFSMGGGNDKGIYSVVPFNWEDQDAVDSPVRWHTGNPDTDPWEWRMRVLEERSDIAYGKLFFRTSGYITDEWYPRFLSIRRGKETLEQAYFNGTVSRDAKRIYDAVTSHGALALHEIKLFGGFRREENSTFERALNELQMRMFLTICGRTRRKNRTGEEYGWNSTAFISVEDFWEERGVSLAISDANNAYEEIRNRILKLNPAAKESVIRRFIRG